MAGVPEGIDGYFSGENAAVIHRVFLEHLSGNSLEVYHFGPYVAEDYERVSVNCISWFGRDLAKINGNVVGNEEQFLAVDHPRQHGLLNCICGTAMACHFIGLTSRPPNTADKLQNATP